MVEVSVAEHDARARRVRITDLGRAALARSAEVLRACDEAWADQVGPERYRVFREVLAEVALGGAGESALGEQSGSSRGSVRPSG